jgi:hypothetical protein
MSSFNFNRIYVIESLDSSDKLTGKELYDDLLQWQEHKFKELKADYFPIKNKIDFFDRLNKIKKECIEKRYSPILHLEIHGADDKTGLVLQSKELVTWNELYKYLVEINVSVGNNLFITLAVCHGAHLMQIIRIDKPAPFYGFVGSFDTITVSDLLLRYNEFYSEFFSSLSLNKAMERLHEANPVVPSTYRIISSEETFATVYNGYIIKQLSSEGIEKRKKQVIRDENLTFSNRAERRRFERDFAKKIEVTKEQYYKEHSNIFFMFEEYPENAKRFNVPNSFKEFYKKYQQITTGWRKQGRGATESLC